MHLGSCAGTREARVASVRNLTTMPRALATIMLCDTCLHNDTCTSSFAHRKKPLICNFMVSGNGILGQLTNIFGYKSAAITSCCY